jgi:hypothetical protein
MLVNIAYCGFLFPWFLPQVVFSLTLMAVAAVPKEEILSSGRILTASFFRNVFGETAERAFSVFVAVSAVGNVLSVIFSQGRDMVTFLPPLNNPDG